MKATRVTQLIGAISGVFVCVLFAQTSYARVVQGFENGDPAVTPIGDASYQGTFEGQPAPQGSQQYLLTSFTGAPDNDGFTDVSGTPAVTNASLESFFTGLSLIGFRGSGVLIPFSVMAGDQTLTFQYDFLSNQPEQTSPKNDFAVEAIFNSSNAVAQGGAGGDRFAQVTGSSFSLFGAGAPFIDHTGYQTFSIDVSSLAPGNYELGIGLEALSGGSNQHDSGVLLDNVQVLSVPEPSSITLCIAGAMLLGTLRTRIKRRSS